MNEHEERKKQNNHRPDPKDDHLLENQKSPDLYEKSHDSLWPSSEESKEGEKETTIEKKNSNVILISEKNKGWREEVPPILKPYFQVIIHRINRKRTKEIESSNNLK